MPHRDVRYALHSAKSALEEVQSNALLGHILRASYEPLRELLRAITRTLNSIEDVERRIADGIPEGEEPPSEELDFVDEWTLDEALKKFYPVFSAELQVANAYVVLQKGAFDTYSLLFSGEKLFPDELAIKVPDAIEDVRAAGMCLAFELGTACGFHVLRAVEAVMNRYWEVLSGGQPPPEPRGMGSILRELHNLKVGDVNALQCITQIKNLHRNPLMHPEDHLTVDEAIGLVGMAQSAIRALLPAIPDPVP